MLSGYLWYNFFNQLQSERGGKMQVNRLLEIVYLLLQQDRVTAGELADRFEVSTRTIYRDIDTIGMAGIPIYTEKGKGGGISLMPDFVLSKSMFSEQEQNEILFALHGLTKMHSPDSDTVIQKLSGIFNKTATNWLDVDFSDWGYDNDEFWEDLKTAILERRITEFEYFNSFNDKALRRVEPFQLWFKSKNWYLKAYDLIKQNLRTFKLTRMRDLFVTNETFAERDLSTIKHTEPAPADKNPIIHLRLWISAEMTYRVLDEFAGCVEKQNDDGSFIVSLHCTEDNWVYGTVLSYGEHIEVLEPEHIKDTVRKKAKKIYDMYI